MENSLFLSAPCHFDREGRSPPPYHVTLSSSSLAYAVSILPFGKMHDLQGGSSSSQKSRFAAIFGSPVFSRSRMGLARRRIDKQTLFSVFFPAFAFCTRSLRSVARFSCSLGRDDKEEVDDKDDFCFQRSFGSLRSLRMTGEEICSL